MRSVPWIYPHRNLIVKLSARPVELSGPTNDDRPRAPCDAARGGEREPRLALLDEAAGAPPRAVPAAAGPRPRFHSPLERRVHSARALPPQLAPPCALLAPPPPHAPLRLACISPLFLCSTRQAGVPRGRPHRARTPSQQTSRATTGDPHGTALQAGLLLTRVRLALDSTRLCSRAPRLTCVTCWARLRSPR